MKKDKRYSVLLTDKQQEQMKKLVFEKKLINETIGEVVLRAMEELKGGK